MKTLLSLRPAWLALAILTPSVGAAELGDPAAPLAVAEWVKGSPITLAEAKGKKILVVEFWATWCPPCRTSIPHLTELQKTYREKDVIFIGVTDEAAAVVKPFVKKMGDQMDYAVVIDKDRQTSAGYMQAYKQGGIPHAFIVDKAGRVVWQGHPMAKLDKALDEVIAGTLDLDKARKRSRAETLLQEYRQLVFGERESARSEELEKELVALDLELGGIQPGRKFDPAALRQQMQFSRALRDYQRALAETQPDAAKLAELERALKAAAPDGFDLAGFKRDMTAQRAIQAYLEEATGEADDAKLAALGRELGAIETKNASLLNEVAWTLLTEEGIKKRDLPLAYKLAKAAFDACDGRQAAIVDTYARALFDTGKVAEAIEYQKKAVALAENDAVREQLTEALKRYETAAK
jgi:thiol-disulfide isomerase/thioredoxin